jgi:cytochrome c biogenesis protein CcdA
MSEPLLATGALVVTIALADSLNPTTVAPAVALAIQEHGARRAAAFTAGVGLVSLAGGLVLVAGPGEAILAAIPHPGERVKHVGEVLFGVVLLVLAGLAWAGRHRLARSLSQSGDEDDREQRRTGLGAVFGLGAGIMALELPTAFPYFAAIAAIVGTGAPVGSQLLLVVLFNLVFVAPLLAIVAVRAIAGDRATDKLARLRDGVARNAGMVLALVLTAAGLALIAVGLGVF